MQYRLNTPTMVLALGDNHQHAVTVPADKVIQVIGPAQDDRFVEVVVDDQHFLMFESDLAERGKPIRKSPADVREPRSLKKVAFGG
jgi:hypothetical protein